MIEMRTDWYHNSKFYKNNNFTDRNHFCLLCYKCLHNLSFDDFIYTLSHNLNKNQITTFF